MSEVFPSGLLETAIYLEVRDLMTSPFSSPSSTSAFETQSRLLPQELLVSLRQYSLRSPVSQMRQSLHYTMSFLQILVQMRDTEYANNTRR